MILVADSGSSKTDWWLSNGADVNTRFECVGLNPTFCTQDFIVETLKNTFTSDDIKIITKIYFYGAGCRSTEEIARVKNALTIFFPDAKSMVDHDIKGSAIATCGNKEGIACILGTGSNVCLWNGSEVMPQIPVFGMGYILGDDGSGSHLGKTLLRKYLYNEMPADLRNELIEMGINKTNIVENVYGKEGANRYLAGFARFIQDRKTHPFLQELVKECFHVFFKTHITKYENYQTLPVNFVGSIAFIFEEQLKEVAAEYGAHVDVVIKKPIDNLLKFHLPDTN
jgi:N-acetylglucosamine kinase-like BadF-type ATPase